MARIFLCHASEDKPQVRDVYQRLAEIPEFEPWLDEEEILPGQDWDYEIERALGQSDFVMVFLSERSVGKIGYVQREFRWAMRHAEEMPEGYIHTIVPIRLEHRCVGSIAMGKKLSGDAYTKEDKRLLETFAYQAAVALEKARLYSDIKPHIAVWGDRKSLEELVTNLVSNAVKYMPGRLPRGPAKQRERRITIALRRTGTQVTLTVRDTGIGIRPADIPYLFDRFYRADGTGRRRRTGLGLAICKQIVDKHGGTIRVDSALGQGTTVTVVFPRP